MHKIRLSILLILIIELFSCNQQGPKQNNNQNNLTDEVRKYSPENQEIFNNLKTKDSLLFSLGFNKCDTNQLRLLISEDFEFYHDQSGITDSKEKFILGIAGLCNMHYKPTRELVQNSLEIYPLYNNGELYGAIQTGEHMFYGEESEKPKYLTSTARFTHVWIIDEGNWKLKRVLSYDHTIPGN